MIKFDIFTQYHNFQNFQILSNSFSVERFVPGSCSWVFCDSNSVLKIEIWQFFTEIWAEKCVRISGFQGGSTFLFQRPPGQELWELGANLMRLGYFQLEQNLRKKSIFFNQLFNWLMDCTLIKFWNFNQISKF